MLGNFKYANPTTVYFGEESLTHLASELRKYGKTIMLVYGEGSIKKNGIYDDVIEILRSENKDVVELAGVMSNPTMKKVYEGIKVAKKHNVDFILAVGAGSVCDYAKAVSISTHFDGNPWETFFIKEEEPTNKIIPVGCIPTMAGTGSEMNAGIVITNTEENLKVGPIFGENVMPKFAIMNPRYTFTVPKYQVVSGIFDTMCHLMEQYFTGHDDNTSDYVAEGLMRSLIHSSRVILDDWQNYEARSNIMWTSTLAMNTLTEMGKHPDWMVHMIGQSIGAYTDAAHGMTLSAVAIPYYRYIMPYGLDKFKRFAMNVWNVDSNNKSDEDVACEGLTLMRQWMVELGLVLNPKELGVSEDMLDDIAEGTFILDGGYKKLSKDEIIMILKEAMLE